MYAIELNKKLFEIDEFLLLTKSVVAVFYSKIGSLYMSIGESSYSYELRSVLSIILEIESESTFITEIRDIL